MEDQTAKSRTRLLFWTLLIVAATVPLLDLGWEPSRRIRWIPLITGRRNIIDILLNVSPYVPFGYWLFLPGSRRIKNVIVAAFMLSLCAETTQIFSRSRFPSTTDLITNTTGAWLGACWASARARENVISRHKTART